MIFEAITAWVPGTCPIAGGSGFDIKAFLATDAGADCCGLPQCGRCLIRYEIDFDPVLPADRVALYRNDIAGPETKTLVVYDEAFWRDDGFNGQSSEPGSVSETTLDSSPAFPWRSTWSVALRGRRQ